MDLTRAFSNNVVFNDERKIRETYKSGLYNYKMRRRKDINNKGEGDLRHKKNKLLF